MENVFRILTERPRRCLDVLFAEHAHYICRHQTVLCHHVRFQPNTHGVVVAHHHHLAHARDTLYARHDVYLQIVGEKRLVVGVVLAVERHQFQLAVLPFLRCHAYFRHLRGQRALCLGHTVLHVHRRHIRVGALLEIDIDGGVARVGGRGGHVGHVLHTVDAFLQRHDDRFLHRLRAGSGIGCRHLYRRWRNIGVLLHGEVGKPDDAKHQDDGRDTCRKNGAVYEHLYLHIVPSLTLHLLLCRRATVLRLRL